MYFSLKNTTMNMSYLHLTGWWDKVYWGGSIFTLTRRGTVIMCGYVVISEQKKINNEENGSCCERLTLIKVNGNHYIYKTCNLISILSDSFIFSFCNIVILEMFLYRGRDRFFLLSWDWHNFNKIFLIFFYTKKLMRDKHFLNKSC